jgi:hypothetical protein
VEAALALHRLDDERRDAFRLDVRREQEIQRLERLVQRDAARSEGSGMW